MTHSADFENCQSGFQEQQKISAMEAANILKDNPAYRHPLK